MAAYQSDQLGGLKLVNPNAYYWMLDPLDGLIRFGVENSSLRAELRHNNLTNRLLKYLCPGASGEQGVRGLAGVNGLPGPNERAWTPTINGNTLSFEAEVPTPLDTPISIRVISGGQVICEVLYYLDGRVVYQCSIYVPTASQFQLKDGILIGSISARGWPSCVVKARQVGPIGAAGDDGEQFLEIVQYFLSDPILRSSRAIAMFRSQKYDLYYTSSGFDSSPVARIRPVGFSDNLSLALDSKYAAVEPAGSAKSIFRWEFAATAAEPDKLGLPVWVPDPACASDIAFDWWNSATGSLPDFRLAGQLPKSCCQEDFFFCPSIIDSKCE